MAKKENNKKHFDLRQKWQERKKQRNAAKGKQVWVWDSYPEGYDVAGNGHWERTEN